MIGKVTECKDIVVTPVERMSQLAQGVRLSQLPYHNGRGLREPPHESGAVYRDRRSFLTTVRPPSCRAKAHKGGVCTIRAAAVAAFTAPLDLCCCFEQVPSYYVRLSFSHGETWKQMHRYIRGQPENKQFALLATANKANANVVCS